ncbi:MAG TPA: FtsQ-type POTRA domain-containing protein [Candidatus Baltobacteraceae bacterium]|nr:FtsQ-type POTRA domain-containing protein [Candidatus Baltobacteraceae bacterium]
MNKASRRPRSAVARLRPFWLLGALLAALAGAAIYWAITWPGFEPRHVRISGNRVVPAQEILARAKISWHTNIWLQNTGALAERLTAIPFIGTVRIYRRLPADLLIDVTERRPYARVAYDNGTAVVDADLRVLQYGAGEQPLPVLVPPHSTDGPPKGAFIHDAAVQRLESDYQTLSRAHAAPLIVRYDQFGDLLAVTHQHVTLLLGDDDDLPKKAALVQPILSQVHIAGKRVAALDLRAPATPVVRYR